MVLAKFTMDVSALDLSPASVLVGLFLGLVLYGAIVVQIFAYFHSTKALTADRVWVKALVVYLAIMETAMIIFNMVYMWRAIGNLFNPVRDFLRTDSDGHGTWPNPILLIGVFVENWLLLGDVLRINTILTVLISTPVQCAMAWRVRVLSCSIILPVIIVATSAASFGLGAATITAGTRLESSPSREPRLVPFAWLLSSAIADTIIAMSFIVILSSKKTGFKQTDNMLTRITQLLVGTGTITAAFTVLDAVLFYHAAGQKPLTNLSYVIPEMMISKLYTNSLLAILNARIVWRDSSTEMEADTGTGALPVFHVTTQTNSTSLATGIPMDGPNNSETGSQEEIEHEKPALTQKPIIQDA